MLKQKTQLKRAYNFNAGPSALPYSVLQKAQAELINFNGSGMSVMEMSHRSNEFEAVLERAENGVRENLGAPDDYAVLFLGGGATLQFSMMPMNFAPKGTTIDMIHTGSWTKKAMAEGKAVAEFRLAYDGTAHKFTKIPAQEELVFHTDAAYVHLCSNNTIAGTEYFNFPKTSRPLVADMSSDIASRAIDVSQFHAVFAGAQKNLGPAGVTVVVIKKEWVETAETSLPPHLQYRTHVKNRSLYNTPPVFGIYMIALVQEWIKECGGAPAVEKMNIEKADLIYHEIDRTGFYTSPVQRDSRSRMNVVYRIKDGDEKLEKKFLAEATDAGFVGLKGHRSVGGLRASLYNAVPKESAVALVDFMRDFEKANG